MTGFSGRGAVGAALLALGYFPLSRDTAPPIRRHPQPAAGKALRGNQLASRAARGAGVLVDPGQAASGSPGCSIRQMCPWCHAPGVSPISPNCCGRSSHPASWFVSRARQRDVRPRVPRRDRQAAQPRARWERHVRALPRRRLRPRGARRGRKNRCQCGVDTTACTELCRHAAPERRHHRGKRSVTGVEVHMMPYIPGGVFLRAET